MGSADTVEDRLDFSSKGLLCGIKHDVDIVHGKAAVEVEHRERGNGGHEPGETQRPTKGKIAFYTCKTALWNVLMRP